MAQLSHASLLCRLPILLVIVAGIVGIFRYGELPARKAPSKKLIEAEPLKTVIERSPVKVDEPPTQKQDDGIAFIKKRYTELLSFKDEPNFWFHGFSDKGPYRKWLEQVELEHEAKRFSQRERAAIGDLLNLGMAYMTGRGKETNYTRFARKEIESVTTAK